jgi:hypothetical protein
VQPPNKSDKTVKLPLVVENYHDYDPPRKTRETVEMLLRYVPSEYLVGLESIVLSNIRAFSHDERKQKIWGRRGKVPLTRSLGWYSSTNRNAPASIRLNIDKIEEAGVKQLSWVPIFGDYLLASTLYHEIGHHIHKFHRPEYEGRENLADAWSRKLYRGFVRKRYPWFIPIGYVLYKVWTPIARRRLRGVVPANDPIFKD